jgi:hypothetical protein
MRADTTASARSFAQQAPFGGSQGLIYGWILQFVLALLPLMILRSRSDQVAVVIRRSEGSWFTLILLNTSVAVIWLSSLLLPHSVAQPVVSVAYLFLIAAILPYLRIFWRALYQQDRVERPEAVRSVA